jgi:hypothetical protein
MDHRGSPWRLYPRLAVAGETVGIKLFTDSKAADAAHTAGVAALLARQFADDIKHLKKNLKLPALLKRQVHYFGGMGRGGAAVRVRHPRVVAVNLLTAAQYDAHVETLIDMRVHQCGRDLCDAVVAVVEAHHEAQCRILEIEQKRASPHPWWGSSCRPSRMNWPAWYPTILCRFTTGSASPTWSAT